MNEPKFTPGPWAWDKKRDYVTSQHEDWKHSIICKIATGEDRRQEDANAHLIAAAPELYEACELVDRAGCEDGVDMVTAIDACLLALKKARGES